MKTKSILRVLPALALALLFAHAGFGQAPKKVYSDRIAEGLP